MLNGWLNMEKPYGKSSAYIVNRIKKLLRCKAGHAGTLDPLATGVLPIALGEATKTVSYAVDTVKSYAVNVQWGVQRSTDDAEGDVIATSSLRPSAEEIKGVLGSFIGEIQQVPPKFSALKINGMRACDRCRKGQDISLTSRNVCVTNIELSSINEEDNAANFIVTCEKGVYIRALARDLGIALGCFGYVASLRRKRVGPFSEEGLITLEELERFILEDKLSGIILPLSHVIGSMPKVEADESIVRNVRNGRAVNLRNVNLNALYVTENCDMCYLVRADGAPVALCRIEDGMVKPVRVFVGA